MNKHTKTSLMVMVFAFASLATFPMQSIWRQAANVCKKCINTFRISHVSAIQRPHMPLIHHRSFSINTGLGNHSTPVTQKPFNNYQKFQNATQNTRRWKLAAGLALGAGLFQGATAQAEPEETAMSLEQLTENVKSELAKEEALLMQEFFSLTGIKPHQWEKLKEGCKLELLQEDRDYLAYRCRLLPNNLLRKKLESILRKNDIDPTTIILADDQNPFVSEAHVLQNTICVHSQKIQQWPLAALELCINHEIQHLKHDDWLVGHMLEKYLVEKNPTTAKAFLKKANHFIERRADMLGMLSYARSKNIKVSLTTEDLKYCVCHPITVIATDEDQYGMTKLDLSFRMINDSNSHPGSKKRLTYFNALLKKIPARDNIPCQKCNSKNTATVTVKKSNWFKRLFGY